LRNVRALIDPLQVAAVTAALSCIHPRYGLLWRLGIATGLRVSDLLSLTPSHIAPNNSITITETKTRKHRTIQLDNDIVTDIAQYARIFGVGPDDYIYFSRASNKSRHMSRQWAHRIIALCAHKQGLAHVGAHSMRKIYACNLYSSTRSLEAVQGNLNHSHLSTTMTYLNDLPNLIYRP